MDLYSGKQYLEQAPSCLKSRGKTCRYRLTVCIEQYLSLIRPEYHLPLGLCPLYSNLIHDLIDLGGKATISELTSSQVRAVSRQLLRFFAHAIQYMGSMKGKK